MGEYLYGAPDYAFQVDSDIQKDLQLNVDLTVAMPCRCESLEFFVAPLSLIYIYMYFEIGGQTLRSIYVMLLAIDYI